MPGMLDGSGKAALAERARSRFAAGNNFCLRINIHTKQFRMFIIYVLNIIYTKMTLFHPVRNKTQTQKRRVLFGYLVIHLI